MSGLTIYADLDMTRVEAKEIEWKGRVRRLNDELATTERQALLVTRKVFSAITSTVHALTSVLRAMGIALPASVEAILQSVLGVFASLMAMVTAYLAGGVTAPYAAALAAVAVGFNIGTLAIVAATGQQVNQRLRDAENAVQDIAGAARDWTRLLTGGGGW